MRPTRYEHDDDDEPEYESAYDDDDAYDAEPADETDAPDDDDDALDTVPCPACGEQIPATAESCYHCGEYFGKEAWLAERSGKDLFWWVVAVLVLVLMLWFLLGWML